MESANTKIVKQKKSKDVLLPAEMKAGEMKACVIKLPWRGY